MYIILSLDKPKLPASSERKLQFNKKYVSLDFWGTFSSSPRVKKSRNINSGPHAWGLKEIKIHIIEIMSSNQ